MEVQPKKTSPWVWVGIGCAVMVGGVVALIVFIVTIVFGSMRSSTPYREAVAKAKHDPRVIAAFGSPVKDSYIFSGSINTRNRDGDAKLDIPMYGPKGGGTLRVVATKQRGRWYYNQMVVTPKVGEEIDLMTSPASPEGSTSTAPPGG